MFARVPFTQSPLPPLTAITGFHPIKRRLPIKTVISNCFGDLARIYEEQVNLCLVQRAIPVEIQTFVANTLAGGIRLELSRAVEASGEDVAGLWPQAAEIPGYRAWIADVALLINAYCELFELREAGLRISTLDKAMCPRFHVDRVTARLICSYGGIGTEWLPEYAVDRSKLGMGACGQPDDRSGVIVDPTAIQQMPTYAVGLMKGENWQGNEGRGLVHRSPVPTAEQPRRLLLTLDML